MTKGEVREGGAGGGGTQFAKRARCICFDVPICLSVWKGQHPYCVFLLSR
jgi:hypothetical protein